MDNNELYHYGRLGMKWGQNIFTKAKASSQARKRKKNLEKARQVKAERNAAIKSGKMSSKKMTDKELQNRIARLELEKKYNELLRDQRSSTNSRGQKFISKFLDSSQDKLADNVAADLFAQVVKAKGADSINKLLGQELVYSNNKKKG